MTDSTRAERQTQQDQDDQLPSNAKAVYAETQAAARADVEEAVAKSTGAAK